MAVVPNESKELNGTMLTEKYRPQTLDDIVLPESVKQRFRKMVEDEDIQNILLFSSSPGVGKTTLAKALVNDCDYDYIYINNSLERGIDVLRNRISKYAGSLTFDGKKKAVILDEFDGSSPELQDALRASIEEFHNSCRFICTCNYITKISDALQSRLEPHNFDFSNVDDKKEMMIGMYQRLLGILEAEKIEVDDNNTIKQLVVNFFPDFRKMLVLIQQCVGQHGMITNDIFRIESLGEEFYKMILNKKFTDARRYVVENSINNAELYTLLKTNLLDNNRITDKGKKAAIYMILNEYDYKSNFVTDKELNFAACLMEVFKYI